MRVQEIQLRKFPRPTKKEAKARLKIKHLQLTI